MAFSVFTKYDRNTLIADQNTSMQISCWEESSFEADENYLIEPVNTIASAILPHISEKTSFQTIYLMNYFPEIVIPPPNLSM